MSRLNRRLKLTMGVERMRKPRYASEADFVEQVNAQMQAVKDELLSVFDQISDVTPDIMYNALEPTFDKSQEYVPVDKGPLKASGYLEVTGTGKSARVEMGYAKGGNPPYAVYVHEMTGFHHEHPTRAKFLQSAIQEDYDDLIGRLSMQYGEFMGLGPSGGKYRG